MRAFPLVAVAASLALSGCTTYALSNPKASETYLASASANDLFEIQAAELAVTQAQREDVRAYAQRVIDDHGRMTQHLSDAALEAGVTAPSAGLTSTQQRSLGDLQREPAGSFDAAYLLAQLPAQKEAIRLHSAYALTGEAEPLRRVAAMAVAKDKQHLSDVQRIRREAGFDES